MATTQTETLDVSVKGRRGLERQMTVRVPTDEIEREVDTRLKKVGRTARLKGFRPARCRTKSFASATAARFGTKSYRM